MVMLYSEGLETGDPQRPFVARITMGRNVFKEWTATSLDAAQREADAWLDDFARQHGLQPVQKEGQGRRPRASRRLPTARGNAADALADARAMKALEEVPPPPAPARGGRFKQADLTRAMKAMTAAGVTVARVEINPNGTIVIFTDAASSSPARVNSWDDVLDPGWMGSAEHARQSKEQERRFFGERAKRKRA
jgi:hypothetical protein